MLTEDTTEGQGAGAGGVLGNMCPLLLQKDQVSKCAEMYAAAILRSKPGEESKDHMWEQAQKLLESLRGDDVDDAPWRKSIVLERFRGLVSADDIRPHDFVN